MAFPFSIQAFLSLVLSYAMTVWSILHINSAWFATIFRRGRLVKSSDPNVFSIIGQIKTISKDHETASLLHELIEMDGAGSWPPRASHGDMWPLALRPYHDIYLQLAPSLSVQQVSLDDNVNSERCSQYRETMRKLLQDNVNLPEVEAILAAVEAGNKLSFPSDAYNGFFACIALSRHAYRWATIPVVKAAQEERFIDLPPELDLPWSFLRRHYGVTSQGGNVTSNYFYNFDDRENIVYQINCSGTETIRSAEYHFAHMFPVMEKLALPIYHDMVKSIISFEHGQRDKCLHFLKSINTQLRLPLKVYYDTLVESKISRSVWLSYVQGFQGWAAGEMIDGNYVEYDGLSGNQLPLFQIVDAFVGLNRYLDEENMLRYIPLSQRKLTMSLRQNCFRHKAKQDGDSEIEAEMLKIIKQLRVFRLAHRARARPYLSTDAPERLIMTAGKSVLESSTVQTIKAAIDFLDAMLVKRLRETL